MDVLALGGGGDEQAITCHRVDKVLKALRPLQQHLHLPLCTITTTGGGIGVVFGGNDGTVRKD